MAENGTKSKDENAAKNAKPLDKAGAARLVKRQVPELGEDGKPTGKMLDKAVTEAEVFSFREIGDRIVVVTVDGQKLSGAR